MESNKSSFSQRISPWLSFIAIPIELGICYLIYKFIMGNPENFMGNDPSNNPIQGNYLGIVYKGGLVVPVLMTLFLLVITFVIERFITLHRVSGKENIIVFVQKIKELLKEGNIEKAHEVCNAQKGSIANVIRASLIKYKEMEANTTLDEEKKIRSIEKEIEETTHLEMPMLEKNLGIISTVASIATLIGLFGTVLGMIKAFAALANAGSPDAVALANGISEALVNTALGISTAALAIIFYNYFTNRIDNMTYRIDEAGYSIVQTFAIMHPSK